MALHQRSTSLVWLVLAGLLVTTPAFSQEGESDDDTQNDVEVLTPPDVDPSAELAEPRELLGDAPPFEVIPRIPILEEGGNYPCTDCHDNDSQVSNPRVRKLEDEHDDIKLVHGAGRFWCLTCHASTDRDNLRTLENKRVGFDESYLICGQCHFTQFKDFTYGAHGKRKGRWKDERILSICTECHDPHDPRIKPRKPLEAPRVRAGLPEPAKGGGVHKVPIWKQVAGAPHGQEAGH